MEKYRVWFLDSENKKTYRTTVKAYGIVPAIEFAVKKNAERHGYCYGWEIIKAEKV